MKVNANKEISNSQYSLVFYDGFKEDVIDLKKWIPYYLPHWSAKKKSKPRYSLLNNNLVLKIETDQLPWCPEFNDEVRVSSIQTGLFSGMKNSKFGQHRFSKKCKVREEQGLIKLFTPQYGYFEMRAKCNISENNVAAFWIIGFESKPEHSSEICIFELKGGNIQRDNATVGYGLRSFNDENIRDDFFEERFNIEVKKWNIYSMEWTPDRVNFFINNKMTRSISQSPKYEMQLMLSLYDTENRNTHPMEFYIDYIACFQKQ